MNVSIPKLKCLEDIIVLFAGKAGRKGSSWTWPFRHLSTKHPKLNQAPCALLTPSPLPVPIVFISPYPLFWGLKNSGAFSPVWPQQLLELVSLIVRQIT